MWALLFTSPYAKTPSYEKFKEDLENPKGKHKKEVKQTAPINKKMGTIRGTDLTRG